MELELLTAKFDKAPPAAVKLDAVSAAVGVSDAVKVMVAVPPLASDDADEVMVMVGATVSRVNVNVVLLAVLPAVSVSVTTTVWLPSTAGAV